MTAISPLRFFTITRLHSPYMLIALGAAWLSGIVVLLVDPSRGSDALGPLVLLQMFAASSGFAVAARRGHLDLLLTGGASRVHVALTHLGLSVLPGVVAWATFAGVEMIASRTVAPGALASGTLVAVGLVSTLAWALTVRLPRLSGGIAWLLAIAVWLVGWSDGSTVIDAVQRGTAGYSTRALVITLCPFILLGKRLPGDQALAAVPGACLALLLGACAVIWISRMDVPLESAQ